MGAVGSHSLYITLWIMELLIKELLQRLDALEKRVER